MPRINHHNTYWHDNVFGDQNADNYFIGYGEGLDILFGGNRNDTFRMTFEYDEYCDFVFGGAGEDTLDFSLADRGLSIDLGLGLAGLVVYDWNSLLSG